MKQNIKNGNFVMIAMLLIAIALGVIYIFTIKLAPAQDGLGSQASIASSDQGASEEDQFITYLQATVHATIVAVTPNSEDGTLSAGFLDVEILRDDGEYTEEGARVVLSPFLKVEGMEESEIVEGARISLPNAHILSTEPDIALLAEYIQPLTTK